MLAYAAGRPRIGERRSSPNALLVIISAHIAVLAAVMSAKMDLPRHIANNPIVIRFIRVPPPPPPSVRNMRPVLQPRQTTVFTPPAQVPTPTPRQQIPETRQALPHSDETGPVLAPPNGQADLRPVPVQTSTPAQPLTPPSELKPPYPESKLLAGEEAALTLRLTVDENGRVVAVDPIGRADPVFLAAARRHLMAHWRYKPAMQDGRAVASTLVVTLRFELDD